MNIKDLIGFQLVSINDEKIIVKKNKKEYVLHIKDYEGDCCGYNEIETRLLIDEKDLSRNMTENEIKEALECASYYDCDKCPHHQENCDDRIADQYELSKEALDLINRLQAENERLSLIVKDLGKAGVSVDKLIMLKDAKAEAIKEFAERLKINYSKPLFAVGTYNEFIREVDNLVKEMVGED